MQHIFCKGRNVYKMLDNLMTFLSSFVHLFQCFSSPLSSSLSSLSSPHHYSLFISVTVISGRGLGEVLPPERVLLRGFPLLVLLCSFAPFPCDLFPLSQGLQTTRYPEPMALCVPVDCVLLSQGRGPEKVDGPQYSIRADISGQPFGYGMWCMKGFLASFFRIKRSPSRQPYGSLRNGMTAFNISPFIRAS